MQAKRIPPQMVPGPINEATARTYFARGSAEKLLGNQWRTFCFLLLAVVLVMGLALWQLIPLKTVEVHIASKTPSGRLLVDESTGDWTPDQDIILYFLSDWVSNLTEVNQATWERTTARAIDLTVNTGTDQARDFLRRSENNPAILLKNNATFVRTYALASSNIIKDGSALLRFRTLTRSSVGGAAVQQSYAMTINYARIKPTTKSQATSNPSGLAVTSFNISEESNSK